MGISYEESLEPEVAGWLDAREHEVYYLKYLIRARIEVEGVVDKHDVIGAIFGQTEGLLGPEFDLRELQEKGKIGRIAVELKVQDNKVKGEVRIPSNMDRVETALLAAMIETVDKVGPYNARIATHRIVDLRLEKLKKAIERAKEILAAWQQAEAPDVREILREIESSLRPPQVVEYGPERLPAGPSVEASEELVIVEGRADVLNLLRAGVTNVIAVEGAQAEAPETVKRLANSKKKVVVFLDGDRGGDMVLDMLLKSGVPVHYVARAPPGKEVEELPIKDVRRLLAQAVPLAQPAPPAKPAEAAPGAPAVEEKAVTPPAPVEEKELAVEIPRSIVELIRQISGTLEAYVYDSQWNLLKQVPVRELYDTLTSMEDSRAKYVVFDGIITQRLYDVATQRGVSLLVGARVGNVSRKEGGPALLTFQELLA